MDQQAFRQLVSSSADPSSAVSGGGSSNAQKRPKKAGGESIGPVDPSQLRPRSVASSSTYLDRAATRRLGDDETTTTVQKKRAESLRGDVDPPVPVKGLDFALLAENKAKLAQRADDNEDEEEEKLERAFKQSKHIHVNSPVEIERQKDSGPRSRAEIIEALKRRGRLPSDGPESSLGKHFRPIGSVPASAPIKSAADSDDYKWVNGKRMRKKKKHGTALSNQTPRLPVKEQVKAGKSSTDAAKPDLARSAEPASKLSLIPPTEPALTDLTYASEEPRQAASEAPVPDSNVRVKDGEDEDDDDEEEEEDIFADVGGWSGLPDIDDNKADVDTVQARSERETGERVLDPPSPPMHADASLSLTHSTSPLPLDLPGPPATVETAAQAPLSLALTDTVSAAQPIPTPDLQHSHPTLRKPGRSKWEDSSDDNEDARHDKKRKPNKKKKGPSRR